MKRSSLEKSDIEVVDPVELFNRTIAADLDPTVLDIEEGDIPIAPNIAKWILDRKFLGFSSVYPRQLEIALNLYEDFCPECSDPRIKEELWPWDKIDDILDHVQLLEYSVCPNCQKSKIDFSSENKISFVNELTGIAGMRGGKTALTGGMCATYSLHRIIMLPSPSKFYGLLPKSSLQMTFFAPTTTQAYETLWQGFVDAFDSCNWFREYIDFLHDESKRRGIPLYAGHPYAKSYVYFPAKKVSAGYLAADPRTSRGRTRFFCAIDELGWFDNTPGAVRMNGVEAYHAATKSLRTIRSAAENLRSRGVVDVPEGIMADISSPSAMNDPIMSLMRDQKENHRIYKFHFSTWEMNPNLTEKSLSQEIKDRVVFNRDYKAIPPLSSDPFLGDMAEEIYNRMISKTPIASPFRGCHKSYSDSEKGLSGEYLFYDITKVDNDSQTPRCIAIDMGESYNSWATTIGRLDPDTEKTILEGIIEVSPDGDWDNPRKVHFPSMFESLKKLCDSMNIVLVLYDRWNSVHQSQEFRSMGIDSRQYSLTPQDFTDFRLRCNSSELIMPIPERPLKVVASDLGLDRSKYPNAHAGLQLCTVREVGRKVVKPLDGEDDIFRCLVLMDKHIQENKALFISSGPLLSKRVGKGNVTSYRGRTTGTERMTTGNSRATVSSYRGRSLRRY